MKLKLKKFLSVVIMLCMVMTMLPAGILTAFAVTAPQVSYSIGKAYKYTSGETGITEVSYGATALNSTAVSSIDGNVVTLGTTADKTSTSTNLKLIYVPVEVTVTVPANTELNLKHNIDFDAVRVVEDSGATVTATSAVYYLGETDVSHDLIFYPYYSGGESRGGADPLEIATVYQGESDSTETEFSINTDKTISYNNDTDYEKEFTDYFGVMIVIQKASSVKNTMTAEITFTAEHSHNYGTTGVCFCGNVYVDERAFPDANFLTYVKELSGADDLIFTPAELASIRTISVISKSIASLTGIEHFTEITNLDCRNNQLKSLDVSNNTALEILYCTYNKLTELDLSQNTKLTSLYCSQNQLTELDVSNNTALKGLYCYNNQLTELDVSKNTKLTSLQCYDNQLTELDVSKNTELTILDFYENQLTEIDISKNTKLTDLDFYGNQLTEIDLSNNTELTSLNCHTNQLTELDVSKNTKLTNLCCRNNQLTSLDVSKNTALKYLDCSNNHLTSLDLSKNTLNDNPQVSEYDGTKQTASIEIDPITREFDMSTLDSAFDGTKATVKTASCSFNGNVLTVGEGITSVAYSYAADDIGHSLGVTLAVTVPEIHKHDDVIFDEWTATSGEISSGNYYLTDNVTATATITIPKSSTVTLCLNGKTLDLGNNYLYNPGVLKICDCSSNEGIIKSSAWYTIENYSTDSGVHGNLSITGGQLINTDTNGGAVKNEWAAAAVTGGVLSGVKGIDNVKGTLSVGGDAKVMGTTYGIYNQGTNGSDFAGTLYISGTPVITGNDGTHADIYKSYGSIYAVSKNAPSVAYTGGALTIDVNSPSLWLDKVIIHNASTDKFSVKDNEYCFTQGTGENEEHLVLAENTTHKHDDVTFEKWTATGGTISTSGKYYLVDDLTATSNITIPSGTDITLCLNGKKLDLGSCYIDNGGTLTICDCGSTGKITSSGNYCIRNKYFAPKTIGSDSSVLKIEGGTIESTSTNSEYGSIYNASGTVEISGGKISGKKAIVLDEDCKLALSGDAAVTGTSYAIESEGDIVIDGGTVDGFIENWYGTLILNDGKLINSGEYSVVQNAGTMEINGGEVENDDTGIFNYCGTLHVKDGSIKSTESAAIWNYDGIVYLSGSPVIEGNETSYADIIHSYYEYESVYAHSEDGSTAYSGGVLTFMFEEDDAYEVGKLAVAGVDDTTEKKFTLLGNENYKLVRGTGENADNLVLAVNIAHTHDDVAFEKWTATGGTVSASGNYYLADNVTATGKITIPTDADVTLCLNGKALDLGSTYINNLGTLNICDCQGEQGEIKSACAAATIVNSGTLSVTGGKISCSYADKSAITNYEGGFVSVSGTAEIVNTSSNARGISNEGTLDVLGGVITGINCGISNGGTATVSGGEITGNAGIYNGVNKTLEISGTARITGTLTYGVNSNGPLNISGGVITGSQYGILNVGNLTVSGGEITGKRGIKNTWSYMLEISGTAKVSGTESYGIENRGELYLSGSPEIFGVDEGYADIYSIIDSNIYAESTAETPTAYSGDVLTIEVEEPQNRVGNVVINNIVSDNKDKFSVTNEGYFLKTSGEDLVLAIPHIHDSVTFTEWTATGGTVSASGNYFLADDLTATDNIIIDNGADVTLCLNGKTFDLTEYYIKNNGTLTICDCQTENGEIKANSDAIDNYGTINISGTAEINANNYGVENRNIMTITGGAVTSQDNSAIYNREETSVLKVSGGSIISSGWKAIENFGTVYLSGSPVISGIDA